MANPAETAVMEIAGHLRNWYVSLEENIIQNVSKERQKEAAAAGAESAAGQSVNGAHDDSESTTEHTEESHFVSRRASVGSSILKQSRSPSGASGKRVRWDSSSDLSGTDSHVSTKSSKSAYGGNASKIASAFSSMLQNYSRPGLGKFNIFGSRRQLITARAN
jgi:hypothetical protein